MSYRSALNDAPHWVYWCYDAAGVLLYIGVTSNLPQRQAAHRGSSRWYGQMATTRLTGPFVGSRARRRAMAFEARSIATHRPTNNADRSAVQRNNWVRWERKRTTDHEQGRACGWVSCATCGIRQVAA